MFFGLEDHPSDDGSRSKNPNCQQNKLPVTNVFQHAHSLCWNKIDE